MDAIPPRHFSGTFQGTDHFSEENSTVNNNLLKATNPKCIRENSTLDSTFTVDEVSKGIARLKNKKASGDDSISKEMIMTFSSTILPSLVTTLY